MIAAVILAAGLSRRMGRPKLDLPWGDTTVIGKVVSTLQTGGVTKIIVVTGGARERVEAALAEFEVELVFNPNYADSEMLASLKIGLRELPRSVEACLICLGDHPQIESAIVSQILEVHRTTKEGMIVPSYKMRRGHPWLVAQEYWPEILALSPEESLRTFLDRHSSAIYYLTVNTNRVLLDLDTPEDYLQAQSEK